MDKPYPKLSILDEIRIEIPCTVPWEGMQAEGQHHYCDHCQKTVFDLTEMKTDELERLFDNPDQSPLHPVRPKAGRSNLQYGGTGRPSGQDFPESPASSLIGRINLRTHLSAGMPGDQFDVGVWKPWTLRYAGGNSSKQCEGKRRCSAVLEPIPSDDPRHELSFRDDQREHY
jgi:hypothetical protein